jgi:hypothetical protein
MIDLTKAEVGSRWVTRGDSSYGSDVAELTSTNGGLGMFTIRETADVQWMDDHFYVFLDTGRVYKNNNEHAWDIMHEFKFSECPY